MVGVSIVIFLHILVQMGVLLPRVSLLPLYWPSAAQLFMECVTFTNSSCYCSRIHRYLKLASFSLFLFNLLPLEHLDGGKLLEVLLSVSFNHRTIDLEAAGRPVVERWKRTCRWIHMITITLMATTVFLACFHAFAA